MLAPASLNANKARGANKRRPNRPRIKSEKIHKRKIALSWLKYCTFSIFHLIMRLGNEMIRIMKRIGYILQGIGRSWQAAFWVSLVAYFTFHAFNGANSIGALKDLQIQEQELRALAEAVRIERTMMEDRTSALSGNKLDPDMLEQQVRVRLGFTHPDEVIVLTD